MNDGVLKLIFLFIVKDYAFSINEVQNGDLPQWTHQELDHEVIHPFLRWGKRYVFFLGLLLRLFGFFFWFLLLFPEEPIQHSFFF
jgi:hypothetical protein